MTTNAADRASGPHRVLTVEFTILCGEVFALVLLWTGLSVFVSLAVPTTLAFLSAVS